MNVLHPNFRPIRNCNFSVSSGASLMLGTVLTTKDTVMSKMAQPPGPVS